MLSAFIARPIVELRQRDKSKIESILAYGDRLLVGLNTGSLRIYRVNEPDDKSSSQSAKPVDLLRDLEKFSPKAIEQLAIIKEANILISLSNYIISIHDLQSYTLQEQLAKTKNASAFAVTSNIVNDLATGIPEIISRLAVAVKRRLLVWSWHESDLSSDVTEIALPASIRTLTWASATKIICGTNSGYVIVDVLTKDLEDVVAQGAIGGSTSSEGGRFGGVGSASMGYMGLGGYIPKPLSTRLKEEILLAKDINSLFLDLDGKPLEKRQVPWQQAPESIGFSYPYLVSLQSASKGVLEVRNPQTLNLLQVLSVPNASQLHFPPPTVSLAHAGKGFHVASDRCIWRMGAEDYDAQINELVDKGQYDEAVSMLHMLEDALLQNKEARLREIKMQKAQLIFDQRKFREALELFTEVEAPPERVIKLYPKVISGDLLTQDGDVETENGDAASIGSPKLTLRSKKAKQHKRAVSDTASVRSSKKGDADSDTASIKAKPEEALEGKDLMNAVIELSSFLVSTRTRLQRYLDPMTGHLKRSISNGENGISKEAFDSLLEKPAPASADDVEREETLRKTAKLVDTTLFRAYMLSRPALAGSLFRIPNFCDPDVVNEKLLENGRYNDLVDFFHGKKLHRPALELLQKFGQADEEKAAPALHGPQRTIGYLQNLPPEMIDLILEFAQWPLETNADLGMEIFLADTENAETLPREKVVNYLRDMNVDLLVRYLEHIINELNDLTPDFHNNLVSSYVRDLRGQKDRTTDNWKSLMERLVSFLTSSKQYSLSKAFGIIPRDDPDFYEAQAVVLSNMGQHKQALEIYVFKLKDFEKAEEYCNRVHLSQESPIGSSSQPRRVSTSEPDDPIPSIYHTLLSLYLTPAPPLEPNWQPALSLLSKHGSRLPASSTLNLIPARLPVTELESYFRGRIRAANSIVNESRVVAGLRKTEVISAQAMLLLGNGLSNGPGGRNRRVIVGEDRVCGVCHKRLGASVIAVLPDNSVVHYGCVNRIKPRTPDRNGIQERVSQWT